MQCENYMRLNDEEPRILYEKMGEAVLMKLRFKQYEGSAPAILAVLVDAEKHFGQAGCTRQLLFIKWTKQNLLKDIAESMLPELQSDIKTLLCEDPHSDQVKELIMLYVNYCVAFHQPGQAEEIVQMAKRLRAIGAKEQNFIDLVKMLYSEKYEKIIEMTQNVGVLNSNYKFIRATALYHCGRNLEARSLFDQIHNVEGAAMAAAKMNDFDGAFAYIGPRFKECEQTDF